MDTRNLSIGSNSGGDGFLLNKLELFNTSQTFLKVKPFKKYIPLNKIAFNKNYNRNPKDLSKLNNGYLLITVKITYPQNLENKEYYNNKFVLNFEAGVFL